MFSFRILISNTLSAAQKRIYGNFKWVLFNFYHFLLNNNRIASVILPIEF